MRPTSSSLFPPIIYDWWWLAIGLAGLLLLIGWIAYILYSTRKPPRPEPEDKGPMAEKWEPARLKVLGLLDALEQRFRAGDIDRRELHLELSAIVRSFAKVRAGIKADVQTLTELEANPAARPVAKIIAYYYEPEFARDARVDDLGSIEAARQVVTNW